MTASIGHPLLLAAILAWGATAQAGTIGRTWPIAEPDALGEIEAKASTLPPLGNRFGPRAGWSAMQTTALGPVERERVRTVVPFYTLPDDLRLPDGRILYPMGFSFNPLSYVRLAQTLIIVAPQDLGWALERAGPNDWILLASGSGSPPDPIALGQKAGRPLFLLERAVKERLGLTVAPVIVRQVGQRLELHELRAGPTTRKAS